MLQIREIDHVVLRSRQVVPMLAFYREVLGCVLERSQPELGLWQLRAGASLVDLVAVDSPMGRAGGAAPGPEGHNLDHLCFRLVAFDAVALGAHLRHHGVAPGEVVQRFGADGEGPSMYLQDPDGNGIELKGGMS